MEERKMPLSTQLRAYLPHLVRFEVITVSMIVEATKTDDPALLPHLKVLASNEKWRSMRDRAEFQAHVALAKLGDPFAIQEIFSEVDSRDYLTRSGAVAKLAQIGNRDANRKLFALLDDTTVRDDSKSNDEIIYPNSQLVMEELGNIFKDAPKKPNGVVIYDITAWKEWFAKNKYLIE